MKSISTKNESTLPVDNPVAGVRFVSCVMWSTVTLASVSASFILHCSWCSVLFMYLGGVFSFFAWHVLAHQRWTRLMHVVHLNHHSKVFLYNVAGVPKSETTHRTVCEKTVRRLAHEGPLYASMGLCLSVVWLCGGVPNWQTATFGVCFCLAYIQAGFWLHESFHTAGHWLDGRRWFESLRLLHVVHHKYTLNESGARTNFSIGAFLFDDLLHTKTELPSDPQALAHISSLASPTLSVPTHGSSNANASTDAGETRSTATPTSAASSTLTHRSVARPVTARHHHTFKSVARSVQMLHHMQHASLIDHLHASTVGIGL